MTDQMMTDLRLLAFLGALIALGAFLRWRRQKKARAEFMAKAHRVFRWASRNPDDPLAIEIRKFGEEAARAVRRPDRAFRWPVDEE